MKNFLILTIFFLLCCSPKPIQQKKQTLRFASYNVALFRAKQGDLARDLSSGEDIQIKNVAAVIQKINPDVIALLEFDYDHSGQLLDDFNNQYLAKTQHGQAAVSFPYRMQVPSNTGVPVQADYNNDGKIELPNDAYGFGAYEGQYAFAILSKYPILEFDIRSFRQFLWKDMPYAKIPLREDGSPWYSVDAWNAFRLSSKNHIDIPVKINYPANGGTTIHTIIAHPTPPVFDGPEDRNGKRNFDEIRLLKDYIQNAGYLTDDNGRKGGLTRGRSFVIMGDLNADPIDGDSYPGAINQLLDAPEVNQDIANGKWIPYSNGGKVHNKRSTDQGNPGFDTAFFGARIDYVLPSANLKVLQSGVFWPVEGEELYEVVKDRGASDHVLVWADLMVE